MLLRAPACSPTCAAPSPAPLLARPVVIEVSSSASLLLCLPDSHCAPLLPAHLLTPSCRSSSFSPPACLPTCTAFSSTCLLAHQTACPPTRTCTSAYWRAPPTCSLAYWAIVESSSSVQLATITHLCPRRPSCEPALATLPLACLRFACLPAGPSHSPLLCLLANSAGVRTACSLARRPSHSQWLQTVSIPSLLHLFMQTKNRDRPILRIKHASGIILTLKSGKVS